jgi:hypothetical protein
MKVVMVPIQITFCNLGLKWFYYLGWGWGCGKRPGCLAGVIGFTLKLGCLAGVKTAEELGISKVTAETDSMMLKMAIGGADYSLAPTGGLVHEIKAIAAASFPLFSVSFCPRICNRVAHELAAHGCACPPGSELVWDGVPSGLETLVAGDGTQGRSCPFVIGVLPMYM